MSGSLTGRAYISPDVALRACIQVLVEQRSGEWVRLDELMQLTAQPADSVRRVADLLVQTGELHRAHRDGQEAYGFRVEGVAFNH